MKEQAQPQKQCKSVFQSGQDTTTKQFTEKWIELINQLEKSQSISKAPQL